MFLALFFLPKFKFSFFSYSKKFPLNLLGISLTSKTEVGLNTTGKQDTLHLCLGDAFSLTNLLLLDTGFLAVFRGFRHLDLLNRLKNLNLQKA